MKHFLFAFFFLIGLQSVISQEWQTDFETAKELSKTQNKKIVLVFSGSDWCAPCIKLEKEIFESEEFIEEAKSKFILLKADFPRKSANKLSKEQQAKNNNLASLYNKNGYFPLVVVLNSEGKSLGSTGYKKITPKEYITELAAF